MLLYPRLPRHTAEAMLNEIASASIEDLAAGHALTHPATVVAPTGGNAATEGDLRRVREAIVEVASRAGYPDTTTGRGLGQFDAECAEALFNSMQIVTADAAHSGVWAFLGCVVAPDVACWRFSNRNPERLLGGPRNTFRRLWWRMRVLGCDDASLLKKLGEDELVQVMERPTIGGNPRLAVALCKGFLETIDETTDVGRMQLMREAAKRVIRLAPSVSLDSLDVRATNALVQEVLDESVRALEGKPPERHPRPPGGIQMGGTLSQSVPAKTGEPVPGAVVDGAPVSPPKGTEEVDNRQRITRRPARGGNVELDAQAATELDSFVPFRPNDRRTEEAPKYLGDQTLGAIRFAVVLSVQAGASTMDEVVEALPSMLGCQGELSRAEAKLVRRLLWSAAARGWIEIDGDQVQLVELPDEDELVAGALMDRTPTSLARSAYELLRSHDTPCETGVIIRDLVADSHTSRFARKTVISLLNSMAAADLIEGDVEGGWRTVGV